MKEVQLASTGRMTSALGYGCSGLMGGLSRKESLALLHAAFDCGLRHFDVAPMYGFGAAEECLGEFLQQRSDQVTVTTKFGISPAKNRWLLDAARGFAKPVMALIPGLKKQMARAANLVADTGATLPFTAERAMTSLEESLGKLRVSRIDLFLLHEATAESLRDDRLFEALHRAVDDGKIGGFGVGSEAGRIADLVARKPEYCQVIQTDWSVLDVPLPQSTAFQIHHRSLGDSYRRLRERLQTSPDVCLRWSEETGVDLGDSETLGRLMMKAALEQNSDGLLLFSSRNPHHMRANVELLEDTGLAGPALRFYRLMQQETLTTSSRRVASFDEHVET